MHQPLVHAAVHAVFSRLPRRAHQRCRTQPATHTTLADLLCETLNSQFVRRLSQTCRPLKLNGHCETHQRRSSSHSSVTLQKRARCTSARALPSLCISNCNSSKHTVPHAPKPRPRSLCLLPSCSPGVRAAHTVPAAPQTRTDFQTRCTQHLQHPWHTPLVPKQT